MIFRQIVGSVQRDMHQLPWNTVPETLILTSQTGVAQNHHAADDEVLSFDVVGLALLPCSLQLHYHTSDSGKIRNRFFDAVNYLLKRLLRSLQSTQGCLWFEL